MLNKLIKSLALGAFAIGGGITTLASTSCSSGFTPTGDFTISYNGSPYLGVVINNQQFTSKGKISFSNLPDDIPSTKTISLNLISLNGLGIVSDGEFSNFDPFNLSFTINVTYFDKDDWAMIKNLTIPLIVDVFITWEVNDNTKYYFSSPLVFYFHFTNC